MKTLSEYLMESTDLERSWKKFTKNVLDKIKIKWDKSDDDVFNTVKDSIIDAITKDKSQYIVQEPAEWNPRMYNEDCCWIPFSFVDEGEERAISVQLYRTGFNSQYPERAFIDISLCRMHNGEPGVALKSYYIKK